jgi:hypothetical protein
VEEVSDLGWRELGVNSAHTGSKLALSVLAESAGSNSPIMLNCGNIESLPYCEKNSLKVWVDFTLLGLNSVLSLNLPLLCEPRV